MLRISHRPSRYSALSHSRRLIWPAVFSCSAQNLEVARVEIALEKSRKESAELRKTLDYCKRRIETATARPSSRPAYFFHADVVNAARHWERTVWFAPGSRFWASWAFSPFGH